jgi:hypothetical protein
MLYTEHIDLSKDDQRSKQWTLTVSAGQDTFPSMGRIGEVS